MNFLVPRALKILSVVWLGIFLSAMSTSLLAQNCGSRVFTKEENTVLQAYVAFYGRAADTEGLAYWAQRLTDEGGNLDSIIASFGNSAEYISRFSGLDNTTLINNIFQQLFGRDADAEGLSYYVGLLDSGERSLESIALDVMNGAQNSDLVVVDNRLILSRHYIQEFFPGFTIDFSAEQLSSFNASVLDTESSLEKACAAVSEYALTTSDFVITVGGSDATKFTTLIDYNRSDVHYFESATVITAIETGIHAEEIAGVVARVKVNASITEASVSISDAGKPTSVVVGNVRTDMEYQNGNTIMRFFDVATGNLITSISKPTDNDGYANAERAFGSLQGTNTSPGESKIAKRYAGFSDLETYYVEGDSREILLADYAASVTNWTGCTLFNTIAGLDSGQSDNVVNVADWAQGACLSNFFVQTDGLSNNDRIARRLEVIDLGYADYLSDILNTIVTSISEETFLADGVGGSLVGIPGDTQVEISRNRLELGRDSPDGDIDIDSIENYIIYYDVYDDTLWEQWETWEISFDYIGPTSSSVTAPISETFPVTITGLENDKNYYFFITAVEFDGTEHDLGVDAAFATPRQPYTKLDIDGTALSADATSWSCVRHNESGLVWEVKTDDGGIHDMNNTFRWGGNGADKVGSEFFDDWNNLIEESKNYNLCGFSDWRVPSANELKSVAVDQYGYLSSYYIDFFPETEMIEHGYWSVSAGNYSELRALSGRFDRGYYSQNNYARSSYLNVRLVRGSLVEPD